jgi:translocator protein
VSARPAEGHATPGGKRSLLGLVVFIALSFGAAAIGGLATDPGFYTELDRPPWAPPSWLFGPVWSVLYVLIGVAGWRVWRAVDAPRGALAVWALQLGLNAAWSLVFFGLQEVGWALVEIVVLAGAIIATIIVFARRDRLAALLLVPYLAWVLFATALNAALYLRL